MEKLNRKQCSAILRARASMLMVKANHKKTYEPNLCRFCHKTPETQEHILQDCLKIKRKNGKVEYNKLFEDNVETLKGIAESIITIEEIIRNPNLNSMSSSDRSEPPGWPGHMQYYYYYNLITSSRVGSVVHRLFHNPNLLFGLFSLATPLARMAAFTTGLWALVCDTWWCFHMRCYSIHNKSRIYLTQTIMLADN